MSVVYVRTTRYDSATETFVRNVSETYDDGPEPTVTRLDFDSCADCRKGFRPGETIAYYLYEGLDGVSHAACVPEGSDIQATV